LFPFWKQLPPTTQPVCRNGGESAEDHIVEVTAMVELGKSS
jgi:hypothetical protein